MVPTMGGELRRKRRMMVGLWDIVVGEGMVSPRGYGPLYGFEIASHRIIRYATPLLHLLALATNLALLGHGAVYSVTLALQAALIAAAVLAPLLPLAPLRICRYYVMVTASIALGLWDRMRQGPPASLGEGRGHPVSRALDAALAALILILFSPLLALAAVWIRLDSRGPVIYRQRRVGLGGREFELLKLRTMVAGSDPVGVGTVVGRDDPRVTRPGRFLRRTSLDEVPNLINVLRGEMALVGPRPTIPGPGGRLHAAPAPSPRGEARDHRLGAGQGPRRDPLGGADRARPLLRRAPRSRARPADPGAHRRPDRQRPGPRPRLTTPRSSAPGWRATRVCAMSDPAVSLRRFEPGDAAAVHRWFNNAEATRTLMEQRAFLLRGAGARLGCEGDRGRRRGPQVRDRRRGPRRAGRLHRALWPRPPDRPRARRPDRRRCPRQGRRPPSRGADHRQGLRRVRSPPRLRAHPRPQRGGKAGRDQPRVAPRGDDALAPATRR